MSIILPSGKGKSWVFQVTALCVVLGALLGLSLRTQHQVREEGGLPERMPAIMKMLRETKSLNDKLKEDVDFYKARNEKLSQQLAAGMSGSKGLIQTLNDAKMLAGTIAVRGPGIIVQIKDSPKLDPTETNTEVIESYIVHDRDIRGIVDDLFIAGAEAVSINNNRLIANSSIRCVGPVVHINSTPVAPPYEIKAIGDPEIMRAALMMPGGAADALILMDMFKVTKVEAPGSITVNSYSGGTRYKLAKPITESN